MRAQEPPASPEPAELTLPLHESWLPAQHPLYRPRHSGRQRTALAAASVFFCLPLLALTLGVRPAEFENRPLSQLPGVESGWNVYTGLPQWAIDHLPWRDNAVSAADGISRSVFGEPFPQDQGDGRTPVHTPFAPDSGGDAGAGRVIEGDGGWLYYGFDVEGKCHPLRPLDEVIGNLVRLRQAVESSGRQFILIVAPDKTTVVPQHLPRSYVGKECSRAASAEFWRRAPAEAGAIDLRPDLRRVLEHDGTQPYYQLDTHWDDRGAMLMVRHAAEHIQPRVSAGWKVELERTETSEADLPKLLGRTGMNVVNVYSLAPDGGRDRTQPVHLVLQEPWQVRSPATSGMVRAKVGFLVDSFSLAATRYLPAAFTDAGVVFYSSLSKDPEPTLRMLADRDVVVVEAVERDLVFGSAPIVDSDVIDRIASTLAARPR